MKKKTIVGRLRLALASALLGQQLTLDSVEGWQPSSSAAGVSVSHKTVLSLAAAWACTRLISECVGTLPLHIYERLDNGRRIAREHDLYHVLHRRPNADTIPTTFWESMTASVALRGEALAEVKKIGGRIVSMYFLVPDLLVKANSAGTEYLYNDPEKGTRRIPKSRLWKVPGFSVNGQTGLSAIRYGAQVFGNAIAGVSAANSTLEKGLSSTVVFKLKDTLTKEQRKEFREAMKEVRGALNAGDSPLLERGMEAQPISISPKDAQLLESRAYSVEEVCRFFLVDPSMIGHGSKDSNWGTGLEQKLLRFLAFTLRPYLTRFEQAINAFLIPPAEQDRFYAEFSIEGLLRADSAARAAFYSVMVDHGIFTRDEVRALENLPPMGGNADVLTVQSAMAPLDALGQQTDGDAARAAQANWLKTGDNDEA